MGKTQLKSDMSDNSANVQADVWYGVLTPQGYISYTTRSLRDAEEIANLFDDVIVLQNMGKAKSPVDNTESLV